MHILSREMINIAMQMRQRMRNERGDAPRLNAPNLVEQLLSYAEESTDDHVQRLAGRLRALLPQPEAAPPSALHSRVYRGQAIADEGASHAARTAAASGSGSRKMYRGQPVD